MSPNEQEDALIEATLTSHRERDRFGMPAAPPEWWDLSPEQREEAYWRQLRARELERAFDDRGWSSTVHAIMARIQGA